MPSRHAILLAFLLVFSLITNPVTAVSPSGEDLDQKAKDFVSQEKYSEALKTYDELLQLTREKYGAQNVKTAQILIAMSLIYRYNLNNEKKYEELQEKAKQIQVTLNGTLSCRTPAKLRYGQCRERWLGPDPCFEYENYRNRIKVTYYGLEGSEFKMPQDLVDRLKGLYGQFEAMQTVPFKGQEALQIKIREEAGDYQDRDGKYMMPEFRYEEFILLSLKKGFLVFNLRISSYVPLPSVFTKEEAPNAFYDEAYENYQIWSSFLESCTLTNERT